ncbi:hypothetical protein TNCV_2500131 [Trichonephila clavipes]|nr:hypothetical protein TNCV_2500131 [Trichonephila clavipes]
MRTLRYEDQIYSPIYSPNVLHKHLQLLPWRELEGNAGVWSAGSECSPSISGPYLSIMLWFSLAIHQNDHQARRRFVEWAQNEIAVVPDFHKRILFSDEAHFWLNGYVNKQNCRIWSEANPQVYIETPLHPEKLTVWCALWAGGILPSKTMKATTLQSMVIGIEP